MLENIEVLTHSSIRIKKDKVIYFDPYNIEKNYNDADVIFITHSHYDHYSQKDIDKVKKESTIYVCPEDVAKKLLNTGVNFSNVIVADYNKDTIQYIGDISFSAIPAYNTNKKFHPKENGWVGYVVTIDNVKYYIAGDTDITEENKTVKCDIAFVPVGGTYTMDYNEAANLINIIKPKVAIPIHYGSVVGTKDDAIKFIQLINKEIKGIILMK